MAEFIAYFAIWLFSTVVIRALLKRRSSTHFPPSPRSLPIIGHLHLLAPIPHQALAKLASQHGPLIHIYLGSIPYLVASSPDMAKELLKTHEGTFSDRPQTFATDYLTYGSQDFSFAPYGPYWKFMKKLCMSQLLGGQTLDLLQPIRRREIHHLIELVANKARNGAAVNMGNELIRMTNNVISTMIMNQRCSEDEDEASEIKKLVQDIAELTGKFNLSDYIWLCKNLDLQGFKKRLREIRDRFDLMMEKIISEHHAERGKHDVKDLLHILLDIAADQNSEMKLTKENIKSFILDLFVAGTDTSAITVEWALAELINHPDIMQKAVEEIESMVGRSRLVQESDIINLPFLQAIVKETLRLHPTGPIIVRESSRDCTVTGFEIPSKTRLLVNVWAINRDPGYWEKALEFSPERFMSVSGEGQVDVRGQHFHLLPFGSGRRGCPGTSLAMQVVQVSLAALIQCFQWRVEEIGSGSVSMEEGPGITLPRAHPLVCFPVPRLTPIPTL